MLRRLISERIVWNLGGIRERSGGKVRTREMKSYPGGIKYFPRSPDEVEPQITPTKLLRVERIKPLKNRTKQERILLKSLDLYIPKERCFTVVKNTPTVNAELWKIKHLIEVTPITYPYGEPTANDLRHTVLKENGECLVTKEIAVSEDRIEAHDKFMQNPAKLTNQNIEKLTRLKWLSGYTGGY